MVSHSKSILCFFALSILSACGDHINIGSEKLTGANQSAAFIIPTDPYLKHFGLVTKAFSGGTTNGNDRCLAMAVDTSGNAYCAGRAFGAIGEANGGSGDAFVIKLDYTGAVVWATQLGNVTKAIPGANMASDGCNSVAVDKSGNVYCGGTTFGSLGEGNGGGAQGDAFILKLNSRGELQWVTQLGASTTATGGSNAGSDSCNGIVVDSLGFPYCAGSTTGAMGEVNGGVGTNDVVVFKLNPINGALVWLKQYGASTTVPGGSNAAQDYANSLAIDKNDFLYIGGETRGNFAEANGGGGNSDAFILKLNSAGNFSYATQLGLSTVGPGGSNQYSEGCAGVGVDKDGNAFCGGTTDSDIGELTGGGDDVFVFKLDPLGDLLWATQLGATTGAPLPGGDNSEYNYGYDLAVDNSGSVYLAGETEMAFGEAHTGGWQLDAYVLKLNSSGTLQWVRELGATTIPVGGANGEEFCLGLAVDTSNNVYCGGGTWGSLGEANGGNVDPFIMKLRPDGTLL